ncbi:MAG TPA: cytochrome c biogenesis protein ResB, partial [Bacillota bacterium]|nr:cytochrome c biogenesis protein ResB [Bacillota bacterium]
CSLSRVRGYQTASRSDNVKKVSLNEQLQLGLPGEEAMKRLELLLQKQGFLTRLSGAELTAVKNPFAVLGSVAFHLGLVVLVLGFLLNFLWGAQGILLAPEGVNLNPAVDLRIISRGPLFRAIGEHTLQLERFSYSDGSVFNGKPIPRPVASLAFRDGERENRQELRMNHPAVFRGLRWRYLDSGYSLFLGITSPQGVILSDFVNIASHQGTSWGDTVEISPDSKLDIKFYPDYLKKQDKAVSQSRFPNKPVMELTVIRNGQTAGRSLIPLGQTGQVGDLQVSFPSFRYWALIEATNDPGRSLILLGTLMAVAGLAWRLLWPSKYFACRIEEAENGRTVLSWGVRQNGERALLKEEILAMYRELEAMQSVNA